ncbi:MAG: DUF2859 domain-containing protein [Gammaproteobacteria bacterium]|nr:DUF2859 domain-containing protein [Gammaproteobacteria bacterium]
MIGSSQVLVGFVLLAISIGIQAELQVLGRDSEAIPATVLLGELLSRFETSSTDYPNTQTPPPRQTNIFPIRSDLVPSAKRAGIKRVNVPLSKPICVLGSDRVSIDWLIKNRMELIKHGAICVLIKVQSPTEFELIRNKAHGLTVQIAPFDQLAKLFGIKTVPMLLIGSKTRME